MGMGRGIIAIFANNLPQFEYKQFFANRFENLAEMNNFLVEKKIYPFNSRRNEKHEEILK